MNPRWLLIRRLRGPAFLLMFGVTALLHEYDVLSFAHSWPLYLILAGVLALAERAAFVQPDPSQIPQQQPYAAGYPPQTTAGWQGSWAPAPPAQPGTGIVPAPPTDLERTEGGR